MSGAARRCPRRGRGSGRLLLAALLAWGGGGGAGVAAPAGGPGQARVQPPTPETDPNPIPAEPPAALPTPAAGPDGPVACRTQAARYEDGRGFVLIVTRLGQVRVENPLRPLTPEVTRVLQVVIGGKVATAYGADFATLRRGGTPAAVEALLGGPVRWEAELPALPDGLAIVGEDGASLGQLDFRACEAPPAVKAPPQAAKGKGRGEGKGEGKTGKEGRPNRAAGREGGAKTPAGFSMPQGAIGE
ncbi:hypothetical protein Q8W71_18710 [Methylobacterium sp. NEAU 140]|uniref:hypothetical protein n=1 Tax=Methylobacterium sp. NEAU 140 TaxID=3064945 RepID=UPI0027335F82|nr:hypothetical protein [Methylobacterium sp. NEAU 140]MDP4024662.1 hypothetical protein [Methylobacterium sp. NEAU 140]